MEDVKPIQEDKLIQTIIIGSDWQEVLSSIVVEQGMDPLSIDIIKLTNAFSIYIKKIIDFDFRIPARFILISAILLRMKCELMLEEEKKEREREDQIPPINIEDVPELSQPLNRQPKRKVTLDELISALNKAFEFKEKKEDKKIRMRRLVENLIEPEEDIEMKISRILNNILSRNITTFSSLVPEWKRSIIIEHFLPVLYLCLRGNIICNQEEMFKEIYITAKNNSV